MACKGCSENEFMSRGNITMPGSRQIDIKYLKCRNSHSLIGVSVSSNSPCAKFNRCDKKEKSFKDYCGQDCGDWCDETILEIECPVCKNTMAWVYSGVNITLHPVNEDGDIKSIGNIQIDGNTVKIKPAIIEIKP